jgi:hypothetical protein
MYSRQIPQFCSFGSAIAFSILVLEAFVSIFVSYSPAKALDIADGHAIFTKSPQLIRAAATNTTAGVASSVYQFTIKVPEDAGEPLKALTVIQEANPERIEFDLSKSKAFMGDSFSGGSPVALASIGGSEQMKDNSVTVVFDRPVAPGSTVTVSLRAKENPRFGGLYNFGVMAYPKGDRSTSLYLGSRSLAFSQH